MIESDSKLCILQHTKNLAEFVISLIISAKKLSSQKYRYCKLRSQFSVLSDQVVS